MEQFDYVVIGAGSGGIASARRACEYGIKTAVVESGRLGGTCVNVGCVPKKVMFNAASVAETLELAHEYGFAKIETAPFDWAKLKAARDAYVTRLNGIYQRNLAASGVTLFQGTGRLCEGNVVEVGGQRIQGKHVLLATGGTPRVPAVPGAEHGITSDGFFALESRPERVLIVGSGYIAVELAGVFASLQSEATLLLRGEMLLSKFDPMLREGLMEEMSNAGINILRSKEIQAIEREDSGEKWVREGVHRHGPFDCVIWAVGRVPQSRVSEIPIDLDPEGFVRVDEFQNTSAPHVYAVGDITRGHHLTPVAIYAGRKLADRLFGGHSDAKLDSENIASVVFSHPPIASVGLGEDQARERYGDSIRVYSSRFTNMYFNVTSRKQMSAVKVITAGPTEKVIGVHIIGRGADEMIQGFAVAVKMGATKRDLDRTIAVHPTAAEELVLLR